MRGYLKNSRHEFKIGCNPETFNSLKQFINLIDSKNFLHNESKGEGKSEKFPEIERGALRLGLVEELGT